MHVITKLHLTQYATYTVSPRLKRVQVTWPVDITTQYLGETWKLCLYLINFSTLKYVHKHHIITVNPRKSSHLIQMSENPHKYENFYALFSTHQTSHVSGGRWVTVYCWQCRDGTYIVLLPSAASCTISLWTVVIWMLLLVTLNLHV